MAGGDGSTVWRLPFELPAVGMPAKQDISKCKSEWTTTRGFDETLGQIEQATQVERPALPRGGLGLITGMFRHLHFPMR